MAPIPTDSRDIKQVHLAIFEGPLDLLLHLIQKNELDITAVSLATITAQYLAYLEVMQELNIELASDFLVTAAELARIKSRALLPQGEPEAIDDPADVYNEGELIARLMHYHQFKQLSDMLASRPQLGIDLFPRAVAKADQRVPGAVPVPIRCESPLRLLAIYRGLRDREGVPLLHYVAGEKVSVRQKMVELLDFFRASEGQTLLVDLIAKVATKPQKIGIFLAVLELVRMKVLHLRLDESGARWSLLAGRTPSAEVHHYEEDFRA